MNRKPKQMTLYFNTEDEPLARELEAIANRHALFNGNENKLVRYCIEYTIKNDKSLKARAA